MKMYCFRPSGHGQQTFFTIARSEGEAHQVVSKYIDHELASDEELSLTDFDVEGWATADYSVEVYNAFQVARNDNE